MTRFIAALFCAFFCLAFTSGAEARQRHKTYAAHERCNIDWPCEGVGPSARGERIVKAMGGLGVARKVYTPRDGRRTFSLPHNSAPNLKRVAAVEKRTLQQKRVFAAKSQHPVAASYGPQALAGAVQRVAAAIVAHPTGCPSRAFCGCGAAVRIFGAPIRSLWLAANWFKFPRTAPAPGAVAVRRHHVFVLEADLGGGVWQVYDANSGRHQTRIHARSIAGYAIVNPRAG